MSEKEKCSYIDSIVYAMEHAVIYFKNKGAQVFSTFNLGITIDQFTALEAIYSSENICQRDLSKIILKDRSNTGRILNILEEKDFIKRLVETKNNRLVKMIYITEKGKELVIEGQVKLKNAFLPAFESVPDEDLTHLRNTLSKMKECLSKITIMQI